MESVEVCECFEALTPCSRHGVRRGSVDVDRHTSRRVASRGPKSCPKKRI
jgi:hypothetical protein